MISEPKFNAISSKMNLYHGDCLEVMKDIPDESIDLILADPPYGITQCEWDHVIPFYPMWEHLKRIIKQNGVIALFAMPPFSADLICSNRERFKYTWYWKKSNITGFLNARKQPLRIIEEILIFYENHSPYFPFMTKKGEPKNKGSKQRKPGTYGKLTGSKIFNNIYFPTQFLEISNCNGKNKIHPTQKPIILLEYLIKTYTKKGEVILDFCMGSGSTGVAAKNLDRNFIGIEKDEKYFNLSKKWIEESNTTKEFAFMQ